MKQPEVATLAEDDARLKDASGLWERAVVAMCVRANFSHTEGLKMYREFYAECPHADAAAEFMLDYLTRHMKESR